MKTVARVASLAGQKGCGLGKEGQKGVAWMKGANKGVEAGG